MSLKDIALYKNRIERLILQLADEYNIRVVWNKNTAVLGATFAIAGAFIGGYNGGKLGAALGAGLGGASGVAVSTVVNLQEIWCTIRNKLEELQYIVFNYLRRLDAYDYEWALKLLLASTSSKRELILVITEFIASKLGTQVFSKLTAA